MFTVEVLLPATVFLAVFAFVTWLAEGFWPWFRPYWMRWRLRKERRGDWLAEGNRRPRVRLW